MRQESFTTVRCALPAPPAGQFEGCSSSDLWPGLEFALSKLQLLHGMRRVVHALHSTMHLSSSLARTVTHVRVLAGVAIAAAVCFQRAAAPDHGWVCLRSPTGAGALTAACV